MSIKVTLYEFRKRENSTKQPSEDLPHTEWECTLKEDCGLINPHISINFGYKGNPCFYNYAYISDLGNKYYFIRDWVCEKGYIWSAYLELDVLATWRYRIGVSTQYLERSSFASDGGIVDIMYPAKQPPTIQTVNKASPWTTQLSQGTYVLGILNSEDGGIGAAHYYAFTQAELNEFLSYMLGNPDYLGITEISNELTKALVNPFQYVVSAVWYPFEISGTQTAVKFGWWPTSITAKEVTVASYYFSETIDLPVHPQISRGEYLRKAPYSNYTLYYPGVGTIALDTKDLGTGALSIVCVVDVIANRARLGLNTTDPSRIVSVDYAQLGVPIQLAQFTGDYAGLASGVASSIGMIAGGGIVGAAAGVFNMVGSAVSFLSPDTTKLGVNGSLVSLSYGIQLKALFYLLVDEDNADLGRPLCKAVTVSDYPGYQKVVHADVALSGTLEENLRVKSYMESGYFYE